MQIPLDRLQILMMRFRTEIDIPKADFEIGAAERMLFEPLPGYGESLRGDV